jgi:hypothetical protein
MEPRRIDIAKLKRDFKVACKERGIDPVAGATAHQAFVVAAALNAEKATRATDAALMAKALARGQVPRTGANWWKLVSLWEKPGDPFDNVEAVVMGNILRQLRRNHMDALDVARMVWERDRAQRVPAIWNGKRERVPIPGLASFVPPIAAQAPRSIPMM